MDFFFLSHDLEKRGAKSTRIEIIAIQRKMGIFLVVSKIIHIFANKHGPIWLWRKSGFVIFED